MDIRIGYVYAPIVTLHNFGVTWLHHLQGEVEHRAVELITNSGIITGSLCQD